MLPMNVFISNSDVDYICEMVTQFQKEVVVPQDALSDLDTFVLLPFGVLSRYCMTLIYGLKLLPEYCQKEKASSAQIFKNVSKLVYFFVNVLHF
jgi:hypothetical protein